MNIQVLAQVLAVCVGLFAGIPQLVKSRQTSGRTARMARLTGVLCLVSAISLTLIVTQRFAGSSTAQGVLSTLFVLPALGAIGSWSGSLIWAGPPTHHDKQTFVGAGIFVAATILAIFADMLLTGRGLSG